MAKEATQPLPEMERQLEGLAHQGGQVVVAEMAATLLFRVTDWLWVATQENLVNLTEVGRAAEAQLKFMASQTDNFRMVLGCGIMVEAVMELLHLKHQENSLV